MEVKARYKHTEVGAIPEDWEVKPANQIGTPVRGGSPRPAGDPRYFNGSFIPWLTVAALTNIPASQLVVSETGTSLTEEGSLHSRTLTAGTLIIANSGATLGVAKILGIKCCANDGIAALLNLSRRVSAHYLAHFINTKTRYLRDIVATGNGQPNLNTTLIGNFKIPLPPTKAEQEAIAEALNDADALTESLEQLVAKKRQIKQGAKQELLTGQKRLPGFTGEWETTTFAELLRHHSGNSTLIKGKLSDLPLAGYFDAYSASGQDVWHHDFEHEGDALIVSAVGSRCGKTFEAQGKWSAIANTHVVWPIDGKVDARFLLLFLDNERFWLKSGSGQPFILFRQSFARNLQLPTLPEQTAIADILSDMGTEISALEDKLASVRNLKQGMMQELLTGRIRLL